MLEKVNGGVYASSDNGEIFLPYICIYIYTPYICMYVSRYLDCKTKKKKISKRGQRRGRKNVDALREKPAPSAFQTSLKLNGILLRRIVFRVGSRIRIGELIRGLIYRINERKKL